MSSTFNSTQQPGGAVLSTPPPGGEQEDEAVVDWWARLLWLPYVLLGIFLFAMAFASFFNYHVKNRDRYEDQLYKSEHHDALKKRKYRVTLSSRGVPCGVDPKGLKLARVGITPSQYSDQYSPAVPYNGTVPTSSATSKPHHQHVPHGQELSSPDSTGYNADGSYINESYDSNCDSEKCLIPPGERKHGHEHRQQARTDSQAVARKAGDPTQQKKHRQLPQVPVQSGVQVPQGKPQPSSQRPRPPSSRPQTSGANNMRSQTSTENVPARPQTSAGSAQRVDKGKSLPKAPQPPKVAFGSKASKTAADDYRPDTADTRPDAARLQTPMIPDNSDDTPHPSGSHQPHEVNILKIHTDPHDELTVIQE